MTSVQIAKKADLDAEVTARTLLTQTPTAVKTANYTAAAGDLIPVDTTGGAVTVTLPNAPADGARVTVKHVIQGSTNAVTIACAGADVFNKSGGSTSLTLSLLNQGVILQYKASTHIWYVVADDLSLAQLDLRYSGAPSALTPTAVKTSGYTASASDLVPVDTTGGAVTVTLPNAPADKTQVAVKHVIQGGANAVTVACAGSDVFNKTAGSTSLSLSLLNQAVLLQYKATGGIWYVVTDDLPLAQLDIRYASIVEPLAAACGFRNWNVHPGSLGANAALTSQQVYVQAVYLPAGPVTGVVLDIDVAGVGTAPTGFFVGLCNSAGTMLAQSANLKSSTALTTTGLQLFPFSAPYTVPAAGLYYICILENGAFASTAMKVTSGAAFGGLPGSPPISGAAGTGQTALPANGSALTFTVGSAVGCKFVGPY